MFDRPILYPTAYRWAIIAAALDVICTWVILSSGGAELNAIANRVIQLGGLPAMVTFKFAIIALVITICEVIGRRQQLAGRRLAITAVALNSFPVVVGAGQLGLASL